MIFACILALMGILAFAFSGNPISLMLIVASVGIATREFEDLKQKVEWLEIQLKERDDRLNNLLKELVGDKNESKA